MRVFLCDDPHSMRCTVDDVQGVVITNYGISPSFTWLAEHTTIFRCCSDLSTIYFQYTNGAKEVLCRCLIHTRVNLFSCKAVVWLRGMSDVLLVPKLHAVVLLKINVFIYW